MITPKKDELHQLFSLSLDQIYYFQSYTEKEQKKASTSVLAISKLW